MSIEHIGCCSAYCKTCKELDKGLCKGCKLGYASGERDIERAKCKIKLCCFKEKGLETCADCSHFRDCDIINSRFKVGTPNNRKCIRVLELIHNKGYDNFMEVAKDWPNAWGRLPKE